MAVATGFEITSSNPTSLTVVGGGSLKTEYGSYQFNLGSGAEGEYHEISCVGMDLVTSKFNKYDLYLSDIFSEYISLSDPNHPVPPLPKYVGGSEVHLLLGIKNTNLDPVWIKTLPSDAAVYQSVFKDIWGSDLIFTVPHKSFNNCNKMSNVSHVIFGIHFVIIDQENEHDTWTDKREYAVIAHNELDLMVHPFPINPQDILNVGGEIEPHFEELANCCNHIMEELDPGYSQHFCGVHKAIIPIARMRELVDKDDTANTIIYRCPDCSKCVICKRSLRRTVISLQESVEQTIIESSVKLDIENKKVIVKLPWVRDPVQPLIKKTSRQFIKLKLNSSSSPSVQDTMY